MKNRAIVRTLVVAAVAIFITLLSGVTLAQDMPPLPGELVIGDLQTPRGISFDSAGNLLVTVTGNGGEMQVEMPAIDDPAAMMTVNMGLSGAVLSIGADGVPAPVVGGYPSYATPNETVGLYRSYRQGDSLWLVVSSAGPGAYWGSSVVELDAAGMTRRVISLYPYEAANNPDGNEIDSNVSDIAWTADGTMLITDAGANALLSWTEADGLQTVAVWPSNDVPTSVEVAENGDIYVGFLGAGIAPGAAKIERWSNGALAETFGGMTGVTDILLDGDTLYAVELFLFGEQGPGPGDVLMVSADGNTVVAGGLITPFALAKGPDGALYVSYGTIAFAPGMTGGVVKLAGM